MGTDNSLRDRVRGERNRQQGNGDGGGGQLATKPANNTIEGFLDRVSTDMARILPKHISADRMARIVLTEVRRVPALVKCTQASFYGALMTCAQLGLEPGVGGEAYLIPFENKRKGTFEVQLIIGYQGMVKLYWQSPLAKTIDAQVVYENDEFEYEYGLDARLVHRPSLGNRGKVKCYYSCARLANGGYAFVVMTPEDIRKIRDRSRAKENGPWQTDEDWMSKKTCIRQMFKLIPRSPELERALAQDGAVRTELDEDAIDLTPEYPDAVDGEIVDDEPTAQTAGQQADESQGQQQQQPTTRQRPTGSRGGRTAPADDSTASTDSSADTADPQTSGPADPPDDPNDPAFWAPQQ